MHACAHEVKRRYQGCPLRDAREFTLVLPLKNKLSSGPDLTLSDWFQMEIYSSRHSPGLCYSPCNDGADPYRGLGVVE